jgi:hypothetical protein
MHERVDFAAAAMDVQHHCRRRALADVTSVAEALRKLRLADLQRAFGDRRGLLSVGLAPAPLLQVPVDDESFYAQVQERRGSKKGAMMWVRFARKRAGVGPTIDDVIKVNAVGAAFHHSSTDAFPVRHLGKRAQGPDVPRSAGSGRDG